MTTLCSAEKAEPPLEVLGAGDIDECVTSSARAALEARLEMRLNGGEPLVVKSWKVVDRRPPSTVR